MALETKLVQKLSQNLLMTPQLQQAIRLLTLGRQEYKEAIESELLENPVLEEAKEAEENAKFEEDVSGQAYTEIAFSASDASDDANNEVEAKLIDSTKASPLPLEDYIDSLTDYRGAATPRGLVDYDDKPSLEATASRSETLQDHLAAQLRLLDISREDKEIAVNIIGNLDKNGYLLSSLEEIAQDCGCDVSKAEIALCIVQAMEPIGVGARNLSECLLLQLDCIGLSESLAALIITKHLNKLEKHKFDAIAKDEGTTTEEVYKAVAIIRHLEPQPGRPFADESVRYIVPDIYVQKVGNDYVITLNEDGLPKLRLSPYYLDLLKEVDSPISGQKSYLTERLKAATWLIKSMHQRQHTIYRVAESIIKFQKNFLNYGIGKLKPLILKDVADDIGMHESTVSRVTTNKYVHTPQGVFELKFFFSNGIRTAGGDMSSSSVKDRIRSLIQAESSDNPISDQKIVEILRSEQIDIARRTVAKYREGLSIPSSAQRKRPF